MYALSNECTLAIIREKILIKTTALAWSFLRQKISIENNLKNESNKNMSKEMRDILRKVFPLIRPWRKMRLKENKVERRT